MDRLFSFEDLPVQDHRSEAGILSTHKNLTRKLFLRLDALMNGLAVK